MERIPVDCYTTRVVKTVTFFAHDAYRRDKYVSTRRYVGEDRFGSPIYGNGRIRTRVSDRDYWKERIEETVETDSGAKGDFMTIQSTSRRALELLEQRK